MPVCRIESWWAVVMQRKDGRYLKPAQLHTGFSSISDPLTKREKVTKADTTQEVYCGEQLDRTKVMKADVFTLTWIIKLKLHVKKSSRPLQTLEKCLRKSILEQSDKLFPTWLHSLVDLAGKGGQNKTDATERERESTFDNWLPHHSNEPWYAKHNQHVQQEHTWNKEHLSEHVRSKYTETSQLFTNEEDKTFGQKMAQEREGRRALCCSWCCRSQKGSFVYGGREGLTKTMCFCEASFNLVMRTFASLKHLAGDATCFFQIRILSISS